MKQLSAVTKEALVKFHTLDLLEKKVDILEVQLSELVEQIPADEWSDYVKLTLGEKTCGEVQ